MSKRKDRERALLGRPHRNIKSIKTMRTFVCAHCHEPLSSEMVKEGDFYYHKNCPKIMKPLPYKVIQEEERR